MLSVCVLMQVCVCACKCKSVSDQSDGQSLTCNMPVCFVLAFGRHVSLSTELFIEVVFLCQVSTYQLRHRSYVTSLPQITAFVCGSQYAFLYACRL